MNFLRMGTTGIAAQSFGADDNDGLRVSLGQALIVSLAIAVAILLLQVPDWPTSPFPSWAAMPKRSNTRQRTSRYACGARRARLRTMR